MEQYNGKPIFNGTAVGRILFQPKNRKWVKKRQITDVGAELARYEAAKAVAAGQLQALYEKALEEAGETGAMIFKIHAMLLDDSAYNESVYRMIGEEHVNAEFAAFTAGEQVVAKFVGMEDAYFRARAEDIADVFHRVAGILGGVEQTDDIVHEPVILAADELSPAEMVQMDKTNLLAFVIWHGSPDSHTAILARTMGIPSLSGVEIKESWDGKMAVVDGKRGKLIIDPDDAILQRYLERKKWEENAKLLLEELKGKPDVTIDGKEIKLYANIGSLADVANVLENDAAGIGLLRSEFLYLEKEYCPAEEEQFAVYCSVVKAMAGKKIVIRTLDIGADKQAGYFGIEKEENPALGYRGIRISLDNVDMLKTQLRAVYRAASFGMVSVMFPMIVSVSEVQRIKKICEEVKIELEEKQIPYGNAELGIMVETPAAVLISDLLAKEVDFLCIGTNDLTQYTLAADRQNDRLDSVYDPRHPAVLRMIKMVIEQGHQEGCWVGICGELGADTALTEQFIQMGIDELSVAPHMVLPVRKAIRGAVYKKEE